MKSKTKTRIIIWLALALFFSCITIVSMTAERANGQEKEIPKEVWEELAKELTSLHESLDNAQLVLVMELIQNDIKQLEQKFNFIKFGNVKIERITEVKVGKSVLLACRLLENISGQYWFRGTLFVGNSISYQTGRKPSEIRLLHWITDYEILDSKAVPKALYVAKANNGEWKKIKSFSFYLIIFEKEDSSEFNLSLMIDGRHVDYFEDFWD